jgi:hypothetical protein
VSKSPSRPLKTLAAPDLGAKNMGRFINNLLETKSILFVGFYFLNGLKGFSRPAFHLAWMAVFYIFIFLIAENLDGIFIFIF